MCSSGCADPPADEEPGGRTEDELRRKQVLECTPIDGCAHERELGYCIGKVQATIVAQGTSRATATITIARTSDGSSLPGMTVTDRRALATQNGFWSKWDDGASALTHSRHVSRWKSALYLGDHDFDMRCTYESSGPIANDPCARTVCEEGKHCEARGGYSNPRAACVPDSPGDTTN